MRAITTDVVMFHTLCVCLLDTTAVSPTKTDDSIEIPLGEQTNGPKEPCILDAARIRLGALHVGMHPAYFRQ